MSPLISVIMPCYNSAKTLPLAMSSLISQEYSNWECVIVDDGSTDNTGEVIKQISDPRFRYFRLPQNMGRAVARQKALDEARGEYLSMLDADDWIYPSKLQVQIDFLQAETDVALVSTPTAITDENDFLIGVRSPVNLNEGDKPKIYTPVTKIGPIPVVHGPSMIRMPIARKAKYDPKLLRSQDADFVFQLVREHKYCQIPDVSYVYTDQVLPERQKVVTAYRYAIKRYQKYFREFPLNASKYIFINFLSMLIYDIAYRFGYGKQLFQRRYRLPTASERQNYEAAYEEVMDIKHRLFVHSDWA